MDSAEHDYVGIFRHSWADGFADLWITAETAAKLPEGRNYLNSAGTPNVFDYYRTRDALNLIRSHLWRVQHGMAKRFLVCTIDEAERSDEIVRNNSQLSGFRWVPFEHFLADSEDLSFPDQCAETLLNLAQVLREKTGNYLPIPYVSVPPVAAMPIDRPLTLTLRATEGQIENGMAYGCDEEKAAHVYEMLQSEGFIAAPISSQLPQGLTLTAKGRLELDRIKRKATAAKKEGFFIRAWDPNLNSFFQGVMESVRERTGVQIQAVWDEKHSEKIDDRILQKIDALDFVVLDISQRFNVGFEAGYARARGKTVIAIRRKPEDGEEQQHPFDVTTLSIYLWQEEDPTGLADELVERIEFLNRRPDRIH